MLFNSLDFLLFFIIVTAIFFALPHKYRWFHLLAASCYFYMFFVPVYILILFATIVIDYFAGIWIEQAKGRKRKVLLIISIISNIGVLAVFKYYNFFLDNFNILIGADPRHPVLPYLSILLPIGLSFHTFQAMSYTIEVYLGKQKAEKHFGIYALYVMFYPQLVAGPIERPQNVLHQFHEVKHFDKNDFYIGIKYIIWGMFKKVVIADRLAIMVNQVYGNPHQYKGGMLVVATLFFTVQIYCDFSGYSSIAIGTARVMGYRLMRNFNNPYFSKSVSEFWKRWHISLSTWFRDYLYISLGGNKVSVPRWYFNLFFVFLVSGFWHGANWTFIIWGALHGGYLIFAILIKRPKQKIEEIFRKSRLSVLYTIFQVLITFILVSFAWIFFRAESTSDAFGIIKAIFSSDWGGLLNEEGFSKISSFISLILISFLFLSEFSFVDKLLESKLNERYTVNLVFISTLFVLILTLGVFQQLSFIYYQF